MSIVLQEEEQTVYALEEVCNAHEVRQRWNARARAAGYTHAYSDSAVRVAVFRGKLTPLPRACLPLPLRTELGKNWYLKAEVDSVPLQRVRSPVQSVQVSDATSSAVYVLDELCDAHQVVLRWNRRIHEAGFALTYEMAVVRRAVESGTLAPVATAALPVPLRTDYRKNWFVISEVESVYLHPERAKKQEGEQTRDVWYSCSHKVRDGHVCGATYRASAKVAPWFWCANCRARDRAGWRIYKHAHGPNKHLPLPTTRRGTA